METGELIRVLIVDDSAVNRELLKVMIQTDPEFEIIGFAGDGIEAYEMVEKHRPDIITMDLNMPNMNGYQSIEKIMAYFPTPILVVTSASLEKGSNVAFEALAVGALDIVNRPVLEDMNNLSSSGELHDFLSKIKLLSRVKVITHLKGKLSRGFRKEISTPITAPDQVIVIASSTGGPKALKDIFDKLPASFPAPILVVQHMSHGFIPGLVKWLDSTSKLRVNVAEQDVMVEIGNVYIAPTGAHLKIRRGGFLELDKSPPVNGLRPCADLLFQSAASVFGEKVVAIILTGMGNDGTEGSRSVKFNGGKVIVQDKDSSIIFSMPQNALDAGSVDLVSPIGEIALEIQKQLMFI